MVTTTRSSVIDAGEIEDTFYIFDIEQIKRRIPNQQEGIYYLTCVKGNISPYPTGPGVGTNFRGFKFWPYRSTVSSRLQERSIVVPDPS